MAAVPPLTGLHDIFYQILSHLSPDPKDGGPDLSFEETSESKSARKALYCLARTHSNFTQPALAKMWRSLPSQRPLEHLLCVVGIARRPPPGERSTRTDLELCRTPAAHRSGWERFQGYASLVQKIIVDPLCPGLDFNADLLQDTFWCQLLSACGDTPVLPHLEGATVRGLHRTRSIDTGVLRLVNMSTIRDFDVYFPESSQVDLEKRGKALVECFSSMQNLEVLSMGVLKLESFIQLESLPASHPHLRTVNLFRSIFGVNFCSLYYLANLPNLEYLKIKLRVLDSELPSLNVPIAFPQLRTLSMSCDSEEPVVVSVLLDHISAPRLHTLIIVEMHTVFPDLAQMFPNYLHTLVTKCPSLTRFEWRSNQIWVRRIGFVGHRCASAPLASLIAPLLSNRAMRHVSLTFWGPVQPYLPDDLCAIAKAWPDLETFHLIDEWDEDYDWSERYANPASIAAFARHCPRLRSLRLTAVLFDSDSDSSSAFASEWACRPPAPHWLQKLSIDYVVRFVEGEEEHCSREDVRWFRGLMGKVFRFATIITPFFKSATMVDSSSG